MTDKQSQADPGEDSTRPPRGTTVHFNLGDVADQFYLFPSDSDLWVLHTPCGSQVSALPSHGGVALPFTRVLSLMALHTMGCPGPSELVSEDDAQHDAQHFTWISEAMHGRAQGAAATPEHAEGCSGELDAESCVCGAAEAARAVLYAKDAAAAARAAGRPLSDAIREATAGICEICGRPHTREEEEDVRRVTDMGEEATVTVGNDG